MLQRLRLSDVTTSCANALQLATTDTTRLYDYINQAQEGLLYRVPQYFRYRVCVNEACITWPREIETIEKVAVCDNPGTVRDGWYEFLDGGPGILDEDNSIGTQLVDRGEDCAFDDVLGTGKKIAVYCDKAESASARITLRFYNSNGEKERTYFNGAWMEGESIALPNAGAYTYTTSEVRQYGLYSVEKPITNGMVRLYEYDTVTAALKPIAYYEPDEEVPVYRKSLIPGLTDTTGEDCTSNTVSVIARPRFKKARTTTDLLYVFSVEPLRLACQAIKKSEADLPEESEKYWSLAEKAMRLRLNHQQGRGAVRPINVITGGVFGASGIRRLH